MGMMGGGMRGGGAQGMRPGGGAQGQAGPGRPGAGGAALADAGRRVPDALHHQVVQRRSGTVANSEYGTVPDLRCTVRVSRSRCTGPGTLTQRRPPT